MERGGSQVADILGPGMARIHPRWELRQGQLEMAQAVARILLEGGTLAVEAPTGIGKTLAYLVPALLSKRRVIVSTNTKTLQDQLAAKDLPLLSEVLPAFGFSLSRAEPKSAEAPREGELRYALMKGRSNYLCLLRLERRLEQRELIFTSDTTLRQIADWAQTTDRGDRAELAELSDDAPEWSDVDARAETCIGSRCPRYEECFVVRMRREASAADLVVVNHHLLLADLALRAEASFQPEARSFGEVIPEGDALIIDEAHALEEIAAENFGGKVSTHKLARLSRDLLEWIASRQSPPAVGLAEPGIQALALAQGVFSAIPSGLASGGGRLRLSAPSDPDPFFDLRRSAREAEAALEALSALLEGEAYDPTAESLSRRARGIAASLRFVAAAESPDYVYWAERTAKSARLGATPIEVSGLLKQFLFDAFAAVVMTSATLTTEASDGGGFDYFLGRLGGPEQTERLRLSTPFDFRSQAALFVPEALPLPDEPGFVDAIVEEGARLIDAVGGGAFFLFTSHRMLETVVTRLRRRLRFPVWVQGEAPKQVLIRRFIESAPSVLFATATFWEGVDVPGDPLRLVLIDRLPFASPADPMVAARLERLEQRGESAFFGYQVPQAILRLKQGFGRLVRSRTDRGVVAILDRRLHTRPYGRRFLAALPDAVRSNDLAELSAWLGASRSDREV